jgi:putative addiction module CopG family antidote
MSIAIAPEVEQIINERMRTGSYESTDEVILVALRLLEAQEEQAKTVRDQLMVGIEDLKQGRFSIYTSDEDLDKLAEQIITDIK